MSLPANFSSPPSEELHRIFRNQCIEFKKLIKTSKNVLELQQEMAKFIHTSQKMHWREKNSGVYHKKESDKLMNKVYSELKKYTNDLESNEAQANPQFLFDALVDVEKMIDNMKVW